MTSTLVLFLVPPPPPPPPPPAPDVASPPLPPSELLPGVYERLESLRVLDGRLHGNHVSSVCYSKNYSYCPLCTTVVSSASCDKCLQCPGCRQKLEVEEGGGGRACVKCSCLNTQCSFGETEYENITDKASLFKAVREKAAEEAALLDSIVRSYTDPASNPPPEPKSASAEEERRLPDLVFPVSLYTVRSTTDHLLEQKPGILAKRGVEGSWRKSTSVGWSVRVVGRSERGVVVSAQGVKSLEMYGEGDEDAVIYDEYDDGEDADLWREGAEGEEAWIWTCGVPMALPGELPRDRVLGVGQGGDFAYFHIPLSSDFVKFKVDTDEGYQVKGCVWRRGEYKARTYKWRDWAFRGAVGVQGLAKDDDDDDDDDDDEITFKTGKGVRLAKEKI